MSEEELKSAGILWVNYNRNTVTINCIVRIGNGSDTHKGIVDVDCNNKLSLPKCFCGSVKYKSNVIVLYTSGEHYVSCQKCGAVVVTLTKPSIEDIKNALN